MKTASQTTSQKAAPALGLGEGVLVDPAWLEAHLGDPAVRVVEVDVSRAAYDQWHIDGAVLWNVYADLKDADYRLVDEAAVQQLFSRSGIGPASTVVFYGYAPALGMWLMKLYGHMDARILDCSRDTWRAEGRPWSGTLAGPVATATGYVLPGQDERVRADHGAVRAAIGSPGSTILDVRTREEYQGERFWPSGGMEPGGRPGHVPSAVHQPIDGLYDDRGAFRAPGLPRRWPRRRRGDHLLHDRRAGQHRLVRPHLPARQRARPRLRRVMGRMGPHGRYPC
jgi:thiosulfate/3-mercaptopyruvate sulfurtransferase